MKSTLVILIGPSGVGKTTLAKEAIRAGIATCMIRSVTTRPRGPMEDESEYTFINAAEFNADDCVEHAEYAGNLYGVTKSEIESALKTPFPIVVTEINGAVQLIKYCEGKADVVTVFIDADDKSLRERLEARGRGNVDVRMQRVSKDRDAIPLCSCYILNENGRLASSLNTLQTIYEHWSRVGSADMKGCPNDNK